MKKVLSIALTLIFCCIGIFAFSGCQERKEYIISVQNVPVSFGKYIAKGKSVTKSDQTKIDGKYEYVADYKDALFEEMVVICYDASTYFEENGTKKAKKLWEATGLKGKDTTDESGNKIHVYGLREKNGYVTGLNLEHSGDQTIRIGVGNCYVEIRVSVLTGDNQGQSASGRLDSYKNSNGTTGEITAIE